ncbi:thioesterase II family protein [Streptomyces sp. URMC 123]|uniref:thioesterase II family protein n=1 Tax=Streptomyces sp. URMC 123 TaxID=3423403 RepID=UPI003F194D3F
MIRTRPAEPLARPPRPGRRPPWFVSFDDRPEASLTLICFPFAGASAPAFRPWLPLLPRSVALRAVQLPGRQDRMREPAMTGHREIVDALADAMAERPPERPYAFFGHSMGALLAFELTRELRRRGAPAPVLLGVSGWPAPSGVPSYAPISGLPDDRFLAAVATLGGMPDEVLAEPELINVLLPSLRADFGVCERYRYRPGEPLDIPLTVFGGTRDPMTTMEGLRGWRTESTRPVRVRQYQGDHFYLLQHAPAVVGALVDEIRGASHDTAG